jgi:hypothetical protein
VTSNACSGFRSMHENSIEGICRASPPQRSLHRATGVASDRNSTVCASVELCLPLTKWRAPRPRPRFQSEGETVSRPLCLDRGTRGQVVWTNGDGGEWWWQVEGLGSRRRQVWRDEHKYLSHGLTFSDRIYHRGGRKDTVTWVFEIPIGGGLAVGGTV